jgi:hypothetical protein
MLPLTLEPGSIREEKCSFTLLLIALPVTFVTPTLCVVIDTLAAAPIILPLAVVAIAVVIVEHTVALLQVVNHLALISVATR